MEGVRFGKEELKARYGISERLAVRIGALRAKGIEMTAAVIEEAVRNRDVEALLLSPALLAQADALDTDSLRALAPAAGTLGLYNRILALEEESLAEKAWKSGEPGGTLSVPQRSAPVALEKREAAGLFTPEDVAQIKLTLLTGVEARAKIEALRKLAFAPLNPEERGLLTLKSLSDADPAVRREAAASLQALGLASGLADALSTLAEGTPRQKRLALQKIDNMAGRVAAAERSVTLAFLASDLRFETEPEVLQGILATLTAFSDLLSQGGESLTTLGRHLIKLMAEHFEDLSPNAGRLLREVAGWAGPAVAETLWREIEGVDDRRLKIFFEEAICSMPLSPELRKRLAATIAEDLATQTVEDVPARRLADAFAALGDESLSALIGVYAKVAEENRPRALSVIDAIAASSFVGDKVREEAGELMLQAMRTGGRPVRTLVLESRLCSHAGVPTRIKREMGLDFIENLHTVRAPRIHDLTISTLKRMGFVMIEPLKQTLRKSPHPMVREAALEALVGIAQESKEVDEIIRFVGKLEESGDIRAGLVVRGVARLCASPHASAEVVSSVFRDYMARAGRDIHRTAALGWIAASPACEPRAAGETVLKLVELLEADLPDPELREAKTEEGTMLVVGAQTTVYTELLPDVIDGIRRILLSDRLPEGLRGRVLQRLCAKFRELSSYEEVWAPGNVNELARALAEAAMDSKTPSNLRLKIVSALMTNLQNLSTARVIAEVCSRPDESSRDLAKMVGQIGERLLDLFGRASYQELEDRRTLAVALGRLALNQQVGTTRRKSDEFKLRAVEALLEETGPEFPARRELLGRLAVSPTLPAPGRRRLEGFVKK